MSTLSTRKKSKGILLLNKTQIPEQKQTIKKITLSVFLLGTIGTLSGCSNATLSDYVNIDSQSAIITDPPGARVVVDDKEVGTTPMKFEGENIFEPHWEGTSYMVKSKLVIKKPGCKEYSRIVKDPIPKEIKVKLDCQPGYAERPEPETHRTYTQNTTEKKISAPVKETAGIEERLTQAKKLFDKGLIDKAEYKQLKTKILNDI